MKKALLASTAIVTAAALASPASAADRIKLSLGGFMEQYIGFASNEDDASNPGSATGRDMAIFDQQNDNEVYFSGSTTLDNGIKIAVRMELEGDAAAAGNMDEAWMDIQTSWGTLRLGEDDPVNDLQVIEPKSGILDDYNTWVNPGEGSGIFNVGRNNYGGTGGSAIDDSYITAGDDNVIIYLSPKLAGFQVGFSYTPEIFANNEAMSNRTTDQSGAYSATLNWSGKIMDIGIDAGYAWYKEMGSGAGAATAAASSALTSHQVGLNVTYAGFGIGGNYGRHRGPGDSRATDVNLAGDDGHMYQVGVWYETGPIGVGFLHKYQQNEGGVAGTSGGGNEDQSTLNGVWFNYTISDGVRWESMIFHADFDEETGVDASENSGGWGVVGGLRLDF